MASTASPPRCSTTSPATTRSSISETLVVDFNVALHDRIRAVGAHVEYGDLANPETLHHAGVDRAEVVVSTVPDDLMRGVDNRRLVEIVRSAQSDGDHHRQRGQPRRCRGDLRGRRATTSSCRASRPPAALGEAIGEALNGTLGDYRKTREGEDGKPGAREEVLR